VCGNCTHRVPAALLQCKEEASQARTTVYHRAEALAASPGPPQRARAAPRAARPPWPGAQRARPCPPAWHRPPRSAPPRSVAAAAPSCAARAGAAIRGARAPPGSVPPRPPLAAYGRPPAALARRRAPGARLPTQARRSTAPRPRGSARESARAPGAGARGRARPCAGGCAGPRRAWGCLRLVRARLGCAPGTALRVQRAVGRMCQRARERSAWPRSCGCARMLGRLDISRSSRRAPAGCLRKAAHAAAAGSCMYRARADRLA